MNKAGMDSFYMLRCIELAKNGHGKVAPNPMVGSVIVHKGKIIGEGYHQNYGEAHAEINAINSVKDESLLSESTLYVSLEPCAHFGKTPPCSDLIIKHKIPKVVVGCQDPFSEVSGKGIEKLKNAGFEVVVGVLEKECRELNRRFFTFIEKKRPYVILKWAQTSNGYISSLSPSDSKQISNKFSKMLVHKWRTEEMAIMVGTRTAEADNPKLTAREWPGKDPIRIVIDKNLKLSESLVLFEKGINKTLVFTSQSKSSSDIIEYIQVDFSKNVVTEMLKALHERNIQSVIVEGGTQLLNSFIDSDLWDEARIFTSKTSFENGVKAPEIKGNFISKESIASDELKIILNPKPH